MRGVASVSVARIGYTYPVKRGSLFSRMGGSGLQLTAHMLSAEIQNASPFPAPRMRRNSLKKNAAQKDDEAGVLCMVTWSHSVVGCHQQGSQLEWALSTYGGVGCLPWRAFNELRSRPQGQAGIFEFR